MARRCTSDVQCLNGQRCDVSLHRCVRMDEGAVSEAADAGDGAAADSETEAQAGAAGGADASKPSAGAAGQAASTPQAGAAALPTPMQARDAGSPMPDTPITGPEPQPAKEFAQPGGACTMERQSACAKAGDPRVLVCTGGQWVDGEPCEADSVCSYQLAVQRRCSTIWEECRDKNVGDRICNGVRVISKCSENRVAPDFLSECSASERCDKGACVPDDSSPDVPNPEDEDETSPVEQLCATSAEPYRIALDATSVYWTEIVAGTVKKVPLGGGAPVMLASAATAAEIVVDARNVYYSSQDGFFSVPLGGGTPKRLKDHASAIAVDSSGLYQGNPALEKISTTDGSTTVLLASNFADELVVAGGFLYWTTFSSGPVMKMSVRGGTPVTLHPSNDSRQPAIAVNATHAYWADLDNVKIMKVAIGGGTATAFAEADARCLAVDDAHVYWCAGSAVMKQPTEGGPAAVLAAGQRPNDIAIDSTHVYWINVGTGSGAGSVVRAPK